MACAYRSVSDYSLVPPRMFIQTHAHAPTSHRWARKKHGDPKIASALSVGGCFLRRHWDFDTGRLTESFFPLLFFAIIFSPLLLLVRSFFFFFFFFFFFCLHANCRACAKCSLARENGKWFWNWKQIVHFRETTEAGLAATRAEWVSCCRSFHPQNFSWITAWPGLEEPQELSLVSRRSNLLRNR